MITLTGETWAPVPGHERYEVSDLGRVRSLRYRKRAVVRVLKTGDNGTGYETCQLGRGSIAYVHRLVLGAFAGNCPSGMQCRHLNGDRRDNRLANLAWGTRLENAADKVLHGTTARGERNSTSELTDAAVRKMRRLRSAGFTYTALGARFGVHKSTARLACLRETWSHVA